MFQVDDAGSLDEFEARFPHLNYLKKIEVLVGITNSNLIQNEELVLMLSKWAKEEEHRDVIGKYMSVSNYCIAGMISSPFSWAHDEVTSIIACWDPIQIKALKTLLIFYGIRVDR